MSEWLPSSIVRKSVIRDLAGATALAVAVSWSGAVDAGHSSRPHPFNSASVQWVPEGGGRGAPPQILVGHDGNRYTDIVGEFSTRFRLRADVKSGWRIHGFVLTTGDPDMTDDLPVEQIGGGRGIYTDELDIFQSFTMDAAQAVQQAVAGIVPNRVQQVIDQCNSALPGGPAANERAGGEIQMHIHAGFSAGRWRGSQWGSGWGWWPSEHVEGRPAIANVTFPASVVCLSRNDPRVAELQSPPEPVSVDLLVDPKGEVCPKETEVTAFIYYERPATAKFRFRLDGELSGLYTREAVEVGGGPPIKGASRVTYLVKETRTYHLDPGQHRFRVEVRGGKKSEVKTVRIECPPFKVTSAWLKYGVENKPNCPKEVDEEATFRSTRPGKAPFEIKTQGGLVVHKGTAVFVRKGKAYVAKVTRNLSMNAFDQDMMALIRNQPDANSGWTRLKVECLEVLSGTLDLRAFEATRCEGEAALSIRTNMPGEVPYQLDCTGGRSWSRSAEAQQTGPGTYLGVDVVRFDVSNNEQINCALKTRAPLPVKVLALQGNKYQCHKPSGASGTSDFTPPGRPGDPSPQRVLRGDFSFIDSGSPRCPRQGRALINFVTDQKANVHYSLDCMHGSFSGVAQPKPGPKGGFVAPAAVSFTIKQTTQANCALKTVSPGKPEVHVLKGHLFQCISAPTVPGPGSYTPPTRPDPQTPGGPGRVVVDPPRTPPTPPRIVCSGGSISGGRCVCPRGLNAVAAGANAFRCVKVVTLPPSLTPGPKSSAPQRTQPQKTRPATLQLVPSAIKPAQKKSSAR